MKLIIAGCRDAGGPFGDKLVMEGMESLPWWEVSEVFSGCARGIDAAGERLAFQWGLPVAKFPANWDQLGKRAGHVRNTHMAHYADALLAVWDGHSRGTANMIETARRKGLLVHVHRFSWGQDLEL